jgi:hypothetical protein
MIELGARGAGSGGRGACGPVPLAGCRRPRTGCAPGSPRTCRWHHKSRCARFWFWVWVKVRVLVWGLAN